MKIHQARKEIQNRLEGESLDVWNSMNNERKNDYALYCVLGNEDSINEAVECFVKCEVTGPGEDDDMSEMEGN